MTLLARPSELGRISGADVSYSTARSEATLAATEAKASIVSKATLDSESKTAAGVVQVSKHIYA